MSHFTVLVVGLDHEKQLEPFHEFECTGMDNEFVQDVDVTEEIREHGADWYGLKVIKEEADIDTRGDHKYGYCLVKDLEKEAIGDNVIKAINRTNPNKKWDWWVVGGRWSGSLLLKNGTYVDQAMKDQIDFETMRNNGGKEAAEHFDKVQAIIAGRTWTPWDQIRDKHGPGQIDAAREEFHNQEAIKDLCKPEHRELVGYMVNYESYKIPREQYIARGRANAVSFYAILKDGQWFERGQMGWWGMASNEEDIDTWNQKFEELLNSLPDDALLTVVDCHI